MLVHQRVSDPKNPCKMMQNATAWFEDGENYMAIFADHHAKPLMIQWFFGGDPFSDKPIWRTPKNAEIWCDFRQHHFQETFCCGSMLVSDGLQKASLDSV